MTIKPGADISHLHPNLVHANLIIDKLWGAVFPEDLDGCTITSGHEGDPTDGVHTPTSKHYIPNCASGFGEAEDLRVNDVQQWKATVFAGVLWTVLFLAIGDHFTIFAENILKPGAHIHVQIK